MGRDSRLRIGGILAIALGAGVFWFFILGPLQQAQGGALEVSYSTKPLVLVPFCLVFGTAFLLFGERFEYRTADHKNLTLAGWLAFGVGAALSGLGYWWFEQQFSALGYV